MKDFNWNKFKEGNMKVEVATEEIANDFLQKADKQDIVWVDGSKCVGEHVCGPNEMYYRYANDEFRTGLVFDWTAGGVDDLITWEIEEDELTMDTFTWKEFKEGNIRVSAATEEIAMDFFVKANAQDIYWANGNNVVMTPKWNESIYYRYDGGLVHGAMQWNLSPTDKVMAWKIDDELNVNINSIDWSTGWDREEKKEMETNKRIKLGELEEGKEYYAYDGDGRFQPNIKYRKLEDRLQFTTMIAGQASWVESGLGIFEMLTWEFEEIIPKKETGWFDKENKDHSDHWVYYIDEESCVDSFKWDGCLSDHITFEVANCFTTRAKAEEEADKDTLRRLMQRFADENNEGDFDWKAKNIDSNEKWYIYYDHRSDKYAIDYSFTYETEMTVYFTEYAIAERCMDDVVIPFKERVCE